MPAYGLLWLGSTTGWNSPPATCSMPRARQIPEAMIGRLLKERAAEWLGGQCVRARARYRVRLRATGVLTE